MKTVALTMAANQNDYYLRTRYVRFITKAAEMFGMDIMPVVIPITENEELIKKYARAFDGYIVIGGGDIDPSYYSEERHENCGGQEPERDEYDLRLLRELIALDRPVMGICRGCQAMNVVLGGTLWQDCASMIPLTAPHCVNNEKGAPNHPVNVTGWLAGLLGKDKITTNSYHHQAVKDPGEGLEICAVSEDGIVESIRHPSLKYYRAFQWHPELDPDEISFIILKDFLEIL